MNPHGSCTLCGREFRSKRAREIAERYAAVIADLRGIKPAEHLRQPNYAAEEARSKAERVAHYRQTGELQNAA